MAAVEQLTDDTFADAVKSGVAVVDFWAPWCGPCIPQGRIIEELAATMEEEVRIAKLNVDTAPRIAARFDIRAIPTVIIFRNGEPLQRFVGVTMGSELAEAIDQAQTW